MSAQTQPPEPLNQNRDARLYMLGMWVLSLAIGAFFPYVGLDAPLSLVMVLLVLAATCVTSGLVVFTFRRYLARPILFVAGVALSALAFVFLNALSGGAPPLPIQSISSVVALLAANLLWMSLLVGLLLILTGSGGWPLLITGSVVALWTPLIAVRSGSVEAFIGAMLGVSGQTSPINVVFCGALCAIPVGGIAILTRLLRGLWQETAVSTGPSRPK